MVNVYTSSPIKLQILESLYMYILNQETHSGCAWGHQKSADGDIRGKIMWIKLCIQGTGLREGTVYHGYI